MFSIICTLYTEISCLPDTTVTGPWTLASLCFVKFLTMHCNRVDFPTLGGPTMAITIGGGSSGVLSTMGMCCFLVLISCVLQYLIHGYMLMSLYMKNVLAHTITFQISLDILLIVLSHKYTLKTKTFFV